MQGRSHQLRSVVVGDDPAAWDAAGFSADGDTITVGRTAIVCVGPAGGRGIRSLELDDLTPDVTPDTGLVDGLAVTGASAPTSSPPTAGPEHPNRVSALDHVVALSPDMDRTTAALVAAGLDHRRDRRFEVDGGRRRQSFFWLGDVILELVGDDDAHGAGPATFWGLAAIVDDLDRAAAVLGDRLGTARDAVQAGRRIATVRTRDLDLSVPLALMTPHRRSR